MTVRVVVVLMSFLPHLTEGAAEAQTHQSDVPKATLSPRECGPQPGEWPQGLVSWLCPMSPARPTGRRLRDVTPPMCSKAQGQLVSPPSPSAATAIKVAWSSEHALSPLRCPQQGLGSGRHPSSAADPTCQAQARTGDPTPGVSTGKAGAGGAEGGPRTAKCVSKSGGLALARGDSRRKCCLFCPDSGDPGDGSRELGSPQRPPSPAASKHT